MSTQDIVAFNGNIDITEQILILGGAIGYRSKCEGKTISLYRNGELLADGVMNLTNAESAEILPSLCGAELTYHDETFEAFSQDDTYTAVLGDEEPINMAFNGEASLVSQEMFDGINPFIAGIDNVWYSQGDGYSTFSIAQNVQTTRKKYDIKLLPEECLPKSVAKKSEVKNVEKMANEAYDRADRAYSYADNVWVIANSAKTTAESAQSTANSAKTTAESAQSTANSAKTTANSAQSTANIAKITAEIVDQTAVKETSGGSYTIKSSYANSPYTSLNFTDYSLSRCVSAKIGENTALSIIIDRDGGTSSDSTIKNPATIKLHNAGGAGGVIIDGLKSIIMVSSTPNSAKRFKITVNDTGTISATEVTA